jgi:hypothetical protein
VGVRERDVTDIERALVEFYVTDLSRARRIVAEHVLDERGRCVRCTGVGCSLRSAALQALELTRKKGSGR